MNGTPPIDEIELRRAGWGIRSGLDISSSLDAYRDYISRSRGEWSVAKNAYVQSRSGWFSCRSACYLALGVPAIVQDTGFSCALPTGEGILSFSTADGARSAIEAVVADPERHTRTARDIVHEYFDSAKVLNRLITQAA